MCFLRNVLLMILNKNVTKSYMLAESLILVVLILFWKGKDSPSRFSIYLFNGICLKRFKKFLLKCFFGILSQMLLYWSYITEISGRLPVAREHSKPFYSSFEFQIREPSHQNHQCFENSLITLETFKFLTDYSLHNCYLLTIVKDMS